MSVSCLLHAVPVSALVLALYTLWFVFLDRRLIFLYGHLRATPFDAATTGRYWMTGLVAGGAVLVAYALFGLVAGALRGDYRPPGWARVWRHACLILAMPLLAILILAGRPAMPPALAVWILIVLFAGLALALYAGHFVATNPRRSVWPALDGLALAPVFVCLPAVEYVLRKPSLPAALALVLPVVALGAGLAWLAVVTLLYRRFKQPFPSPLNVFLSGLTIQFLLLPLLHYVTSRPDDVRYITTDGNFLAASPWLQVAAYVLAAGLVFAASKWRGNDREAGGLRPVREALVLLALLTLTGFWVGQAVIGRDTDAWVCRDGRWVQQGVPPYDQPSDRC